MEHGGLVLARPPPPLGRQRHTVPVAGRGDLVATAATTARLEDPYRPRGAFSSMLYVGRSTVASATLPSISELS